MAAIRLRRGTTRLPTEVNCVLFVRNLPFNISSKEMYPIFGKYGVILTDIYQHQGRQNGGEPPLRLLRRLPLLDHALRPARLDGQEA